MRFIGWLFKTILLVMLVCSLTVLTTGLVVNAYIKSVLKTFNIQLEGAPLTLGSMWTGAWSSEEPQTPVIDDKKAVEATISGEEASEAEVNPQSNEASEQAQEQQESEQSGFEGEEALPVMGQESLEQQQIVMTPEEMGRTKDELQPDEKEKIFRILMTKVPQEEMQSISEAMEGGLTEEELARIEEVMTKYLSQEEYEELTKLLLQ